MATARPPHPSEFSLDVIPDRQQVVVQIAGELDFAASSWLQDEVRELRGRGFDRIVIDLKPLRFINSSGLRALLALRNDAKREGGSLALVPGRAPVQRIFHLTRTRSLFEWIGGTSGRPVDGGWLYGSSASAVREGPSYPAG